MHPSIQNYGGRVKSLVNFQARSVKISASATRSLTAIWIDNFCICCNIGKNEFPADIKHLFEEGRGDQSRVWCSLWELFTRSNEFKHGRTYTDNESRSGHLIEARMKEIIEKIQGILK